MGIWEADRQAEVPGRSQKWEEARMRVSVCACVCAGGPGRPMCCIARGFPHQVSGMTVLYTSENGAGAVKMGQTGHSWRACLSSSQTLGHLSPALSDNPTLAEDCRFIPWGWTWSLPAQQRRLSQQKVGPAPALLATEHWRPGEDFCMWTSGAGRCGLGRAHVLFPGVLQ